MFLNEIPSHFSVLWISVVQFSKTKLRRDSFVATFIFYHANARLSRPFSKVFEFFEKSCGAQQNMGYRFHSGGTSIPNRGGFVKGFLKKPCP